jgi:hypothetical protein
MRILEQRSGRLVVEDRGWRTGLLCWVGSGLIAWKIRGGEEGLGAWIALGLLVLMGWVGIYRYRAVFDLGTGTIRLISSRVGLRRSWTLDLNDIESAAAWAGGGLSSSGSSWSVVLQLQDGKTRALSRVQHPKRETVEPVVKAINNIVHGRGTTWAPLQQMGQAGDPGWTSLADLARQARAGGKIQAIKVLRQERGLDLMGAKRLIEEAMAEEISPES